MSLEDAFPRAPDVEGDPSGEPPPSTPQPTELPPELKSVPDAELRKVLKAARASALRKTKSLPEAKVLVSDVFIKLTTTRRWDPQKAPLLPYFLLVLDSEFKNRVSSAAPEREEIMRVVLGVATVLGVFGVVSRPRCASCSRHGRLPTGTRGFAFDDSCVLLSTRPTRSSGSGALTEACARSSRSSSLTRLSRRRLRGSSLSTSTGQRSSSLNSASDSGGRERTLPTCWQACRGQCW
jgi:hypothetical protein